MVHRIIVPDFSELTDSTILANSENGSDKSEGIEILGYGDVESSSSNKSVDGFELPDTVTLLTHHETGAKVYLVGTAHFSKESQEDVRNVSIFNTCKVKINVDAYKVE